MAEHNNDHDTEQEPHMAEHKPGSMDITEQERTFQGFIRMTIRAVIVIFAILLFLALVNA